MMKPMAAEAKMNKAEAAEPKSGHHRPAGPARGSDVGNETKADMKGGLEGQPTDGMRGGLSHAVRELHEQHPIAHYDHGPHHGTDHHIRHEPLHGMKPHKR